MATVDDESVVLGCYPVVGAVVLHAWNDKLFLQKLLAGQQNALSAQLRLTEIGSRLNIVANSPMLLNLVIGSRNIPASSRPLSELRRFFERYSDPRLAALNWIGRDETASQRLISDPAAWLRQNDIPVPGELDIHVHKNSAYETTLVIPERSSTALKAHVFRRIQDGWLPPTTRYARLLGISDYNIFFESPS